MWIRRIQLHNFKSYAQAEFRFPEPEGERNLVLIGAENGHGKTTLLEAIYLCLFDKSAVLHFERAGLSKDKLDYVPFLNHALHHDALINNGGSASRDYYRIELEIEILNRVNGQKQGIHVLRRWHFNSNKVYQPENNDTQVWLINPDDSETVVSHEYIDDYLNEYVIPLDYATFFFFDGEKIVRNAENAGTGVWLRKALEGLAGITLLKSLKQDVNNYASECLKKSGISDTQQQQLDKEQVALTTEQTTFTKIDSEKSQLEQLYREWNAKRDSLHNQLSVGGDIKTSQELIETQTKLKQEIEQGNQQIQAALTAIPLALLPEKQVRDLQTQLRAENVRLLHEAGKEQGEHRVDDFLKAFAENPLAQNVLGPKTLNDKDLWQALREAWEKLWYPLPPNAADKIIHNYLSPQAHADIESEIANIGMPEVDIANLLESMDRQQKLSDELEIKIETLKHTKNDELVDELKHADKQISLLDGDLAKVKHQLANLQDAIRNRQAAIERMQQELMNGQPEQQKAQRANKMVKMIEELSEQLINAKLQALSERATTLNSQIAHDKRIHRIDVASDGTFKRLSENGTEVIDLSAGQMQILIMSLISALADVTHYHAPFVIDTPLARLDEGHRQGLFNHWSNLQQQVILLSQDTEITAEVRQQLHHYVSKTYLIQAETLVTGGAKSHIKENVYF